MVKINWRFWSRAPDLGQFQYEIGVDAGSDRGRFRVTARMVRSRGGRMSSEGPGVYCELQCRGISDLCILMWHCNQCGENDLSRKGKDRGICKQCDAARCRQYRQLNRTRIAERKSRYNDKNRHAINEYKRKLYKKGGNYRTACILRLEFVKQYATATNPHPLALLGCTVEHLIEHLQSQLPPEPILRTTTSIISAPARRPDLTDPEQQRACFHWTNLQPLLPLENMRKGAKI